MTTLEDNWCLYRLVQDARPLKSLEIGIMRGSSSITIGKALQDGEIECEQMALDIDSAAVEAAARHFERHGLGSRYRPIVADSRQYLVSATEEWDFVFLDGDHRYETVAIEFTETFNRMKPGGVIVLHDVGSVRWGANEDPGTLFFTAIDDEVGESASMTWLDSTCCSFDMRLRTSLGFHSTLPIISMGLAVGYGGLGILQKLDDSRELTLDRLIARKPANRPIFIPPPPSRSLLRRVASRVANNLGI